MRGDDTIIVIITHFKLHTHIVGTTTMYVFVTRTSSTAVMVLLVLHDMRPRRSPNLYYMNLRSACVMMASLLPSYLLIRTYVTYAACNPIVFTTT